MPFGYSEKCQRKANYCFCEVKTKALLNFMDSRFLCFFYEWNINVRQSWVYAAVNVKGGACQWEPLGHFQLANFHDCCSPESTKNVPPSKQNSSLCLGDPDFWYVTLWLTSNHKVVIPFHPSTIFHLTLFVFICRNKTVLLLYMWKHCIPEGFAGSINHWNGSIVISSLHRIRQAL